MVSIRPFNPICETRAYFGFRAILTDRFGVFYVSDITNAPLNMPRSSSPPTTIRLHLNSYCGVNNPF